MKNKGKIAVYGAYGHTGKFIVAELEKRGLDAKLSGRNAEKLGELDKTFPHFEKRAAAIDDPDSLDDFIENTDILINCAGPFAETSESLVEAALRAKIPYLDVAAEVEAAVSTFERFDQKARESKIPIVPSIAFYGGLGDLLATAAFGGWKKADEISLAIALDSWQPTVGTLKTIRTSKNRRENRRLVFSNGKFELRNDAAPQEIRRFPPPFGEQTVVGEFTTADSVTIPRHLKTTQLKTFITAAPLKDLSGGTLPLSAPDDAGRRSSQIFFVEAIVRAGDEERRASAAGQDIYAVSAPLVVEAAERILSGSNDKFGAFAAGELFDAKDFLEALSPDYLTLNF